jgi:hypothetical protein
VLPRPLPDCQHRPERRPHRSNVPWKSAIRQRIAVPKGREITTCTLRLFVLRSRRLSTSSQPCTGKSPTRMVVRFGRPVPGADPAPDARRQPTRSAASLYKETAISTTRIAPRPRGAAAVDGVGRPRRARAGARPHGPSAAHRASAARPNRGPATPTVPSAGGEGPGSAPSTATTHRGERRWRSSRGRPEAHRQRRPRPRFPLALVTTVRRVETRERSFVPANRRRSSDHGRQARASLSGHPARACVRRREPPSRDRVQRARSGLRTRPWTVSGGGAPRPGRRDFEDPRADLWGRLIGCPGGCVRVSTKAAEHSPHERRFGVARTLGTGLSSTLSMESRRLVCDALPGESGARLRDTYRCARAPRTCTV